MTRLMTSVYNVAHLIDHRPHLGPLLDPLEGRIPGAPAAVAGPLGELLPEETIEHVEVLVPQLALAQDLPAPHARKCASEGVCSSKAAYTEHQTQPSDFAVTPI